jgi:hypothetical protein
LASDTVAAPQPPPKASKFSSVWAGLWPWLGYLVITLFLLRGLLPVVTDHLPGTTDGWQNMWNLWWMRYALLDLHTNPFFTDYIYYANGTDLLFHTFAPLNGVLALPLTVTLGPLLTTSLIVISSFVFTGMGAFALARGLGLGRFESWLAGAVYTFCNPARWQYLGGGQADQLMMQWMPLYILCLVKATSKEYISDPASRLPWKWLAGAVVFYVFNALTNWQFFVYMSLFSAMNAIYLLFRERDWKERTRTISYLAIVAGGTLLLLLPLLYTTIAAALHPGYALTPPIQQTIDHSWDLTTFVTPNGSNPLWGGWATQQGFAGNRYGAVLGVSNAGYVPILLAVVGLVVYGRKIYQWAIFGLVFAVLALGPILHVNGADSFGGIEVPLPYNLLNIPFFNISRDPARFSLTAILCLGLLAGFGWKALKQTVDNGARKGWMADRLRLLLDNRLASYTAMILAAIIVTGEFSMITYPITTQPIPQYFYKLAQDPEAYALLEVPIIDKDYAEYTEALSSIHHKKIMGGQIARKPCYCFAMETPVVRWFWDLAMPGNDDIVSNPDPSTYATAILRYFNLRYIVIYKWMLDADRYRAANTLVDAIMPGVQPVADDKAATIYAVPPISTTTVMPILLLDGWGALEKGPNGPLRWVGNDQVQAVVVNATAGERMVKLEMKVTSYYQPHTLQIDLNGSKVATAPMTTTIQIVTFDLALMPGRNVIRLSSVEDGVRPSKVAPPSADTRILTFAVLSLSIK